MKELGLLNLSAFICVHLRISAFNLSVSTRVLRCIQFTAVLQFQNYRRRFRVSTTLAGVVVVLLAVLTLGSTVCAADGNPFVYIAGYDNTVTCFEFNSATGELK